MIGQTISHYKILEKLGSGGMGDVYKAQDTKLKRTVALKFLAPNLTRDEEAKLRFIHEAQAASALDQNNICTIYEIDETDDGQMFIAMAYYPGETLTQKIARGPLPLDEAIDIAVHVAEGLSHAHEQGIVHRDIKPANIMVTERGEVKIVDFGLAKLAGGTQLTKEGTTLGTMSYISPEQAQTHEVDHRTDIWSLGVVLYEMVTGRLPFQAEHAPAVVYSIVNEEPEPLTGLRKDAPTDLERIVNKALAKNPHDRYQTAADLQVDLQKTLTGFGTLSGFKARQPTSRSTKKMRAVWFAAASLVLIAAILTITFWPSSKQESPPTISAPLLASKGFESDPSFSPDGRHIAFSWTKEDGDNTDIYVRLVAGGDPVQITQHPGSDRFPAWAPDGQEIAFIRETEQEKSIYAVPAWGGEARRLHTLNNRRDVIWWLFLDWSADGRYLVFRDGDPQGGPTSLYLLDVETREVTQVTSPPKETNGDLQSAFSPDSKTLAFVRRWSNYNADIFTVAVSSGEPQRLTLGNMDPWFVTWTPDGRKLIFNSNLGGNRTLWSISASGGTPEPLPASASGRNTGPLAVSRVGNKMAYTEMSHSVDIWRLSRSGQRLGKPEPFVATTARERSPQISPDGRHLVYQSDRSGTEQIWMCNANGENPVKLTSHVKGAGSPRWSPDSQNIVYDTSDRVYTDIYIINIEERISRPVTQEDYDQMIPSWSHDGQWIYFCSSQEGTQNIWKKRVADGRIEQVTFNGGSWAFESSDGEWLYYTRGETSGIWRKPVEGGDERRFLDVQIAAWDWALSDSGLFYVGFGSKIEYFDFATKTFEVVAQIGADVVMEPAASRDGDWLFFRVDESTSNIHVVENFHW